MKKFFPFLLLTACAIGSKTVTMESFAEIDLHAQTPTVIEKLGEPYAIRQLPDGYVEYEYVERIKIGARDAEERHYFLLMKEGRVVSKRVKQSSPLPYGVDWFDSYEMQTTQGDASE